MPHTAWASSRPPAGHGSATGCNSLGSNNATKIYFACPTAKLATGAAFPNATDLVFSGTVEVGSSNSLTAPVVQRMYVRGVSATTGTGFDIKGDTRIHAGTTAAPRTCAAQQTASPTSRNELVVLQGPVSSTGGNVFLCQTTLVMADTTGTCLEPLTATVPGPTPYTNTCRGTVNLGGNGAIDWSAPNTVSTAASNWDNLEDLALWTESSDISGIGGGGAMAVTGTFFTPNCDPFKISGGGSQTNGANAQFITRRLEVNGNGQLTMRPNPADAITIPVAPTLGLVR